jgi:hypothetical protein
VTLKWPHNTDFANTLSEYTVLTEPLFNTICSKYLVNLDNLGPWKYTEHRRDHFDEVWHEPSGFYGIYTFDTSLSFEAAPPVSAATIKTQKKSSVTKKSVVRKSK